MTKEIIWIADFFSEELNGGAELCDSAWIEFLEKHDYTIRKQKSQILNADLIDPTKTYIFSNFAQLGGRDTFDKIITKLIEQNIKYFILEHDQKFCIFRNAWMHNKSMICDCHKKDSTVHLFYFYAQAVFVQTKFHENLFEQNIYCNTVNLGTNLWKQDEFAWMKECLKNASSNGKYIIFNSTYYNKNTQGAIKFAKENNLTCDLISGLSWKQYIKVLSESEGIIFLPKLPESASRLVFEAKYLGKKVITNKLTGYAWEPWWNEKDVDYDKIVENAKNIFLTTLEARRPDISIFCTTFNSQDFIDGFLDSVLDQSFKNYEVVIYDCGDDDTYKKCLAVSDNKLKVYSSNGKKYGVYKGWNRALSKCRAPIVVNMNVDDRFSHLALEKLYEKLNKKNCDLVYSNSYVTNTPNETFESHTKVQELNWPEYKHELLKRQCFCGHYPMWRKSLLLKSGLFNEALKSASDWLQWIKFSYCKARFEKLNEFLGLYYFNPSGVSTSGNGQSSINEQESSLIFRSFALEPKNTEEVLEWLKNIEFLQDGAMVKTQKK